MNINDYAVIVSIIKHSESSSVVKLLTENNGIFTGYVRGARSKKRIPIYQTGNLVSFNWMARSEDSLGFLDCELIKSYSSDILFSRINLNIINLCFSLLNSLLVERQEEKNLYYQVLNILESFKNTNDNLELIKNYVFFEKSVIEYLGFGIYTDRCAVTGSTENLYYISPRTGCAVTKDVGDIYKDNLLILPNFIKDPSVKTNKEDIFLGLKLTKYFLYKYLEKNNMEKLLDKICIIRKNLLDYLK